MAGLPFSVEVGGKVNGETQALSSVSEGMDGRLASWDVDNDDLLRMRMRFPSDKFGDTSCGLMGLDVSFEFIDVLGGGSSERCVQVDRIDEVIEVSGSSLALSLPVPTRM